MEDKKAYIILKMSIKTGHVIPLGVVLNKQIAIEETYRAKQRYDDEEKGIKISLLESNLWEDNSSVCIGICEHFYNLEH